MRGLLNQRPNLTIGIAAAVIVICAVLVIRQLGPSSEHLYVRPPQELLVWFYDRNTEQLFTMPAHTVGPVETDSGPYRGEPAGVRAHVFACGDCATSERYIGYLEKPSPDEANQPTDGEPALETDFPPLYSRPGGNEWFRADSREAARIEQAAHSRCPNGVTANYCQPTASAD